MNRGARIARGRILVLLNSDAEVDRGCSVAWSRASPRDRTWRWSGRRCVHADGRPQRSVHRPPSLGTECVPEFLRRALRRAQGSSSRSRDAVDRDVPAVRGAVLAVRRDVYASLGGLDERFFFFLEETDLCLRVRRAGHRVLYCPGLEALHRLGASSKRRDPAATRIEYHRALDRFLRKHRGAKVACCVRTLRLVRNLLGLPLWALWALRGAAARRRLAERSALVLWHLRGCPAEPGLAEALARRAEDGAAGRRR